MSKKVWTQKIDLFQKYLGYLLTFLCSVLGILFIGAAQGDITGYYFGLMFLLLAGLVAPNNQIPDPLKIILVIFFLLIVF